MMRFAKTLAFVSVALCAPEPIPDGDDWKMVDRQKYADKSEENKDAYKKAGGKLDDQNKVESDEDWKKNKAAVKAAAKAGAKAGGAAVAATAPVDPTTKDEALKDSAQRRAYVDATFVVPKDDDSEKQKKVEEGIAKIDAAIKAVDDKLKNATDKKDLEDYKKELETRKTELEKKQGSLFWVWVAVALVAFFFILFIVYWFVIRPKQLKKKQQKEEAEKALTAEEDNFYGEF